MLRHAIGNARGGFGGVHEGWMISLYAHRDFVNDQIEFSGRGGAHEKAQAGLAERGKKRLLRIRQSIPSRAPRPAGDAGRNMLVVIIDRRL